MTNFDLVVVGSANLDLVATTDRLPGPGETVLGTQFAEHPGGKGLNQAIAAARAGATVAMHGALGDDAAGHRLRKVAETDGVDMSAVAAITGAPTGRALITVDARGENSIVVVPGSNAQAGPNGTLEASIVLAQLEIPLGAVVDAFRRARWVGARTVLNPSPARDLPDELLTLVDVIVPNEHELDLIGGVEHLLAAGVGAVVVTRGASGVVVTVPSATGPATWEQPAFPVVPIDTTGAGDAFCGAMTACLASGATLADAVEFGAAAGALATQVVGAVPSLPDAASIENLLRGA